MATIKIKPLSVNKVWQGKRFKTNEYKRYERDLLTILPNIKIPKGKLILELRFGFSNKGSDIDNCVKPFVDVLQKRYKFNDRNIYFLFIQKNIVPKGQEYIQFDLSTPESI